MQKQLAKSTVALVSKQRRTKMVDAHTVRYTTTRPGMEDEITLAERREWERKRLRQKEGVLAPPVEPVGGYLCCPETGTWIIAAEGG
jgi:hypothetical protein